MPFELYALRYAMHGGRTAKDNFLRADPHEAGANLDYFIWLARRADEVFVIDTGFGHDAAKARGRTLLRHPTDALALLGVDAREVSQVILTHLHYDHAGTLGGFPAARFHLQVDEAGHATGPCMCNAKARAPFDVENIVAYIRSLYAGRIEFHRGDQELTPGLWLHAIPGHSAGLQAVRVMTKRGWVVLASDATHFYANMERGNPFPVLFDEAALVRGYSRLIELAPSLDHIVPGHDPAVMRAYPAASTELEGVVVRLDVAPSLSWEELSR
ncbi:N-acyl homoserine lactonase family protein [Ciceribacter naphthalenivorans]|uniref:N-acyl homoserine lactonase family protein n=2 Tax=Alphaproteobacteria TaxID=28211 RepID=A0A512HNS6_9HYPH|nr:N-acyl homoserine lactonase family protein [Ciceribacter naphthalenivorans]GLR22643.1 N-acyl homoserine lactonase family protein [Ciceribacter naphthalenivorans]GLT05499.1 N-acyl homoserine lactonase family protein [Sphingomonas psychrolutea]